MKNLLFTTTAIIGLAATSAFADLHTQPISGLDVDSIKEAFSGATKIEVKRGPTQTKIEVIYSDGRKVEVVYDNTSLSAVKYEEYTGMMSDGSSFEFEDESDDDDHDDDHDDDDDDDD